MNTYRLPRVLNLLLAGLATLAVHTSTERFAHAADSRPSLSAFNGTWRYAGDKEEVEQRKKAIEAAAKDFPSFARGRARKRLEERTGPSSELRLAVEGQLLKLSRGGKTIELPLDGTPVPVEVDGKRAQLAAKLDGEQISVVSDADKGKVTTRYALSPDAKRLMVSVKMTGERLKRPLEFQSTYRRA